MKFFLALLLVASFKLFSQDSVCPNDVNASAFPSNSDLLVFGELHGTEQSPAYIFQVVCAAKDTYKNITIFLEIPIDEQIHISDIFEKNNEDEILRILKESRFWSREIQDGRSSVAILNLLRGLGSLNRTEVSVINVHAIAPSRKQIERGLTRAESMAENVRAHLNRTLDSHFAIALVGSQHARKSVQDGTSQQAPNFVNLLSDIKLFSYKMDHIGGTAWVCVKGVEQPFDCGAKERLATTQDSQGVVNSVSFFSDANSGFDGKYNVGAISSSLPAKDLFE